mmetsp:Transcript_29075/g.78187  ORF Transcript_29075/g.78187 Transcript_29075/m.78187 type:complete len:234 (+) Transcript_29075:180-881(+)
MCANLIASTGWAANAFVFVIVVCVVVVVVVPARAGQLAPHCASNDYNEYNADTNLDHPAPHARPDCVVALGWCLRGVGPLRERGGGARHGDVDGALPRTGHNVGVWLPRLWRDHKHRLRRGLHTLDVVHGRGLHWHAGCTLDLLRRWTYLLHGRRRWSPVDDWLGILLLTGRSEDLNCGTRANPLRTLDGHHLFPDLGREFHTRLDTRRDDDLVRLHHGCAGRSLRRGGEWGG